LTDQQRSRALAIDVTRGFALLAMCVSHMGELIAARFPVPGQVMHILGLVATPAFLLMSGVTSGFLLNPQAVQVRPVRFVDRALFILLLVHPVIAVCHVFDQPEDWRLAFASFYIADAIALTLMGVVLMRRLPARSLAICGLILCVVTWPISEWWNPVGEIGRVVNWILFRSGYSMEETGAGLPIGYSVPLVPYVGVYLLGFALGSGAAASIRDSGRSSLSGRLLLLGFTLLCVVTAIKIAYFAVLSQLGPELIRHVWLFTDPRVKFPPGPGYLLFFGGMTVMVFGLALRLRPDATWKGAVVRAVASLGQASLMAYVLQEVLIYFLPRQFGLVGWGGLGFWLFYLIAVIAILVVVAWHWNRRNLNRLITVGLAARFQTPARTAAHRNR
jgi:uncharacterized membrane protein